MPKYQSRRTLAPVLLAEIKEKSDAPDTLEDIAVEEAHSQQVHLKHSLNPLLHPSNHLPDAPTVIKPVFVLDDNSNPLFYNWL